MNPKENIENDKRLTALLAGLRSQWGMSDDFLSIVLWHTDDFDVANEVIEDYFNGDDDKKLEESLIKVLSKENFKKMCLDSDYLDYKLCKELYSKYDE